MHSVATHPARPTPLPPSGRTWADAYEPEHHRRSLDRMIEEMEAPAVTDLSPAAREALNTPPALLQDHVDGIDKQRMRALSDELDGLMQRAALVRGYLDHRERGDGHARSARRASDLVVRLRKILGYSRPDAGRVTF